ncbi:hypothetical protein HPB47_018711 [Ixodes persulcatus]|uniref:Uncharacterized protein n=1 Tax=Ixodes persulcatus TaxID=34615 RepID=A0AC60QK29_IXOPE|nr:hypothetical protein HPB47_018711 [Ixodes persulcatus]
MGATESVIMTFEGTTQSPIPYSTDEQQTAVKCERCRAYGHSALNCPEAPTFWRCTTCAPPLQQQQVLHPCTPWRYHCGGEHTRVDPASEVQQRTDKDSIKACSLRRENLSPRNLAESHTTAVIVAHARLSQGKGGTDAHSTTPPGTHNARGSPASPTVWATRENHLQSNIYARANTKPPHYGRMRTPEHMHANSRRATHIVVGPPLSRNAHGVPKF